MKKGKIRIIMLCFVFCLCFFKNSTLFAQEVEDTNLEQTAKDTEQEMQEEKTEILNMIEECFSDMKKVLISIDQKEKKVKEQEEFEKYPAIRLNVDTPFFGFISMVDNKLKIMKDVSTLDVAKGYSIKDVLNKKTIKLPDVSFGSIVVTTREVAINEEMSYEDASLTLLRVMEYTTQVHSAEEFLDYQINKTFRGYIDKEKSDKIEEIKTKNDKIASDILATDKQLTYLSIMQYDSTILQDYMTRYHALSSQNKSINTRVKDVLMSEETLIELQKETIALEGDLLNLSTEVNNSYKEAIENIDEKKILLALKENLTEKRDKVEEYIDNSTKTKDIEQEEELPVINEIADQEVAEEEKNQEVITKYEVTSKQTLDYMNLALDTIDEKIETFIGTQEETLPKQEENETNETSEENINKIEVTGIEVKEFTKEEKMALVEDLYKIYVEFLQKENQFYLDNTNFLLKDTTDKISDLTGKTKENILSYMKYMYHELPDKLEGYINQNNRSSNIELEELSNCLVEELKTIVEVNTNINQFYQEMIEEELKS